MQQSMSMQVNMGHSHKLGGAGEAVVHAGVCKVVLQVGNGALQRHRIMLVTGGATRGSAAVAWKHRA